MGLKMLTKAMIQSGKACIHLTGVTNRLRQMCNEDNKVRPFCPEIATRVLPRW